MTQKAPTFPAGGLSSLAAAVTFRRPVVATVKLLFTFVQAFIQMAGIARVTFTYAQNVIAITGRTANVIDRSTRSISRRCYEQTAQ